LHGVIDFDGVARLDSGHEDAQRVHRLVQRAGRVIGKQKKREGVRRNKNKKERKEREKKGECTSNNPDTRTASHPSIESHEWSKTESESKQRRKKNKHE
jgi:hypothetical protein